MNIHINCIAVYSFCEEHLKVDASNTTGISNKSDIMSHKRATSEQLNSPQGYNVFFALLTLGKLADPHAHLQSVCL